MAGRLDLRPRPGGAQPDPPDHEAFRGRDLSAMRARLHPRATADTPSSPLCAETRTSRIPTATPPSAPEDMGFARPRSRHGWPRTTLRDTMRSTLSAVPDRTASKARDQEQRCCTARNAHLARHADARRTMAGQRNVYVARCREAARASGRPPSWREPSSPTRLRTSSRASAPTWHHRPHEHRRHRTSTRASGRLTDRPHPIRRCLLRSAPMPDGFYQNPRMTDHLHPRRPRGGRPSPARPSGASPSARAPRSRISATSDAPGYRPDGNCRACMVEVEGERTLVASCIRQPRDGHGRQHRRPSAPRSPASSSSELMADQPRARTPMTATAISGTWPSCRASRRAAFPAIETERVPLLDDSHVAMRVNLDACIHCNLCVRACREVQVNDVIGMAGRGHDAQDRVRHRRSRWAPRPASPAASACRPAPPAR